MGASGLTRARCVAQIGPDADMLCQQIETLRLKVLAERGTDPRVLPDTGQMRDRLFAAKPPGGAFDVRQGAGRLQDIDLLAQSCALRAGDPRGRRWRSCGRVAGRGC